VREGHSLEERQHTWWEAVSSRTFARHPVQMPPAGNALELSEDYGSRRREDNVLAAVGGLSLVGILVVVLIVVAIVYFVRRV
jgi:hypothetical protein